MPQGMFAKTTFNKTKGVLFQSNVEDRLVFLKAEFCQLRRYPIIIWSFSLWLFQGCSNISLSVVAIQCTLKFFQVAVARFLCAVSLKLAVLDKHIFVEIYFLRYL